MEKSVQGSREPHMFGASIFFFFLYFFLGKFI